MHVAVSEQMLWGVTPAFHLSRYQFSACRKADVSVLCLIDTETCRTLTGARTADDQNVVVSACLTGVHAHVDFLGEDHVLVAGRGIRRTETCLQLCVQAAIKAADQGDPAKAPVEKVENMAETQREFHRGLGIGLVKLLEIFVPVCRTIFLGWTQVPTLEILRMGQKRDKERE